VPEVKDWVEVIKLVPATVDVIITKVGIVPTFFAVFAFVVISQLIKWRQEKRADALRQQTESTFQQTIARMASENRMNRLIILNKVMKYPLNKAERIIGEPNQDAVTESAMETVKKDFESMAGKKSKSSGTPKILPSDKPTKLEVVPKTKPEVDGKDAE